MWVQSPSWEDPLEEEMASHSSILPKNAMGRRAWRLTVQKVTKSWMLLSTHVRFSIIDSFHPITLSNIV